MSPTVRSPSFVIPLFLKSMFLELHEQMNFDLLHAAKALDGLDSDALMRKLELCVVNNQSGSAINGARMVVRNPEGISLTFTWGVFEEDLLSAETDSSPKSRLSQDARFSYIPEIAQTLLILADAGFEALPPSEDQGWFIRLIRGQSTAGKMRLGVNATLFVGPRCVALHQSRGRAIPA